MGSKSTYLRVLFFVCLAAGPVIMACEATLDFDRSKIQHYASSDGAVPPTEEEDSGSGEPDPGEPDTGPGTPDTGTTDSGTDADTGT